MMRSFCDVILTKYYLDGQTSKHEMDRACNVWGEKGCIQGFGGET
jgi:hypothetical protein